MYHFGPYSFSYTSSYYSSYSSSYTCSYYSFSHWYCL